MTKEHVSTTIEATPTTGYVKAETVHQLSQSNTTDTRRKLRTVTTTQISGNLTLVYAPKNLVSRDVKTRD
jgi:hypothetical protein